MSDIKQKAKVALDYLNDIEEEQSLLLTQCNALELLMNPESNYSKDTNAIYGMTTIDALKVASEITVPKNKPLLTLKELYDLLQDRLNCVNSDLDDAIASHRGVLVGAMERIKGILYTEKSNADMLQAILDEVNQVI